MMPLATRAVEAGRARDHALAARFGNRLVTSRGGARAARQHHDLDREPAAGRGGVSADDRGRAGRSCASAPSIACRSSRSAPAPRSRATSTRRSAASRIDFRDMNRVLAVHAEDLDCVIEPGVTRKQLNEYLRDQGLFFPIDPGADASLGGMAATRASGTNAVRYGTMKDNVLALKAVLANGEVITTARRAKKSSAGYDLTRLIVGSEGTLGVITELTLQARTASRRRSRPASVRSRRSRRPATPTIATIQSGIPVARIELLDELQVKASQRLFQAHAAGDADAVPRIPRQRSAASRSSRSASARSPREFGGGPFDWATKPEDRTRLWQARHDAYWAVLQPAPGRAGVRDRRVRADLAARRMRHRDAARHRASRAGGADRRPRRRRQFPPLAAGRHRRRGRGRAARKASASGWSSARSRWTAPAPASTGSARAR